MKILNPQDIAAAPYRNAFTYTPESGAINLKERGKLYCITEVRTEANDDTWSCAYFSSAKERNQFTRTGVGVVQFNIPWCAERMKFTGDMTEVSGFYVETGNV